MSSAAACGDVACSVEDWGTEIAAEGKNKGRRRKVKLQTGRGEEQRQSHVCRVYSVASTRGDLEAAVQKDD